MGVTATWDDTEKIAICLTFTAPWDWAQYDRAVAQAQLMLQEVNWPVDVILNLLRGPALPIGRPFAHFGNAVTLLRSRIRCFIVVGGDTSSKTILSMFFGMFFPVGHRLFLVDSVAAAQAALRDQQETRRTPFLNGNLRGMGEGNRADVQLPDSCRTR
jgi:hypothetical protein